jgi:hypothetical protein
MTETSTAGRIAPAPAQEAAALIRNQTGVAAHDIAIILGSGWRPTADVVGSADAELALSDLPGFAPPAVEGHGGSVRSLAVADRRVLMFLGRNSLLRKARHRARRPERPCGPRLGVPCPGADQLLWRHPRWTRSAAAGPDQRLCQPVRSYAAQRGRLRRHDRRLLASPARAGKGNRSDARRRRVRVASRASVRDSGRDSHAADDGRRPGRDVHGPGMHPGTRLRNGGPRHFVGDQRPPRGLPAPRSTTRRSSDEAPRRPPAWAISSTRYCVPYESQASEATTQRFVFHSNDPVVPSRRPRLSGRAVDGVRQFRA